MPKLRPGNQSLKRRSPSLEPKKRILVVVEGRVTEASYFKDIKAEVNSDLLAIEVNNEGGVPRTLVERAVRLKRESDARAEAREDDNERFDTVWCVHDVDDHPHLSDAKQQADAHGIQLAISNPCFELWALLHFQDMTSYQERNAVRTLLRKQIPSYEKKLPLKRLHRASAYFRDASSAYFQAVERAKKLDERHAKVFADGDNPSTGVYRLTEQIRSLTQKRRDP